MKIFYFLFFVKRLSGILANSSKFYHWTKKFWLRPERYQISTIKSVAGFDYSIAFDTKVIIQGNLESVPMKIHESI